MTGFDVVALAKRLGQRLKELDERGGKRVPITPAMSRILANDPDHVPYRPRLAKRYQVTRNPTVATLMTIAAALETTVGDLLGEPAPSPLSPTDRARTRALLRHLQKLV